MKPLLKRLQIWGSYLYGSQQTLLFYGKKPELKIGPLGPTALLILFLNQLLPGQSKCDCICVITVFTEESGWEKWAPNWELPNLSSFAEFTDQWQLSRAQFFILIFILPFITSASIFHLCDLCLTSALTILE